MMEAPVQVQREQARARAEREAALCTALASEYRLMREAIIAHVGEAVGNVAQLRRSIGRELCAQLADAEAEATRAAAGHTERKNQLTAALSAAATWVPPTAWREPDMYERMMAAEKQTERVDAIFEGAW
jgi:hypothetical protein